MIAKSAESVLQFFVKKTPMIQIKSSKLFLK